MEEIYIFFGKCTLLFFIFLLIVKLFGWFFWWNIKNFTWLYQIIDYFIFKYKIKHNNFTLEDINAMISLFKNPKGKLKNGLFVNKAIKLLEEYKKEKFGF